MSNLKKSIRKSLVVGGFCMMSSLAMSAQISLTLENKSTRDVIREIERVSEYRFFYNEDLQGLDQKININASDANIQTVLNEIQRQTSIHYVIKENNQIVLSAGVTSDKMQQVGDSRIIKGTILDATGMPVIGANVMVKGTTNGTITDMDGKFSLEVEEGATLQISYIGYANQEIKVGNQKTLSIALKEDAEALDEVVVVGFGTQKKVNLTGAVSNVTSEAFENRSVANVSQALQGAMPGLNITQSQGYLDATPDINIRGVGTIGEGSSGSPLILIDGMEGDMNRLNPQDIESVSVLKDAAASSIYGSRAPFGVIMITTKKGKSGKLSVNYNNSLRWNKAINMPKSVDSYTFATYFNEAATNAGTAGYFSQERLQKIKDFMEGKISGGVDPDPNNPTRWGDLYVYGYGNTDWINFIFDDTTFSQEHNLSVSGGTDKVQIYASANYLGQDGYIRLNPESNQRISTNLKVTTKLNDWMHINYGMRYNQIDFEKPVYFTDNMFSELSRQSWPVMGAYDPNGYLYSSPTWALPLRDGGQYRKKSNEVTQQLNLVLEPIKGWKIIGDVNYQVYQERVHEDYQKIYNHDVNGVPYQYTRFGTNTSVSENYKGSKYLNINAYTEYSKSFASHNFKIMAGVQSE